MTEGAAWAVPERPGMETPLAPSMEVMTPCAEALAMSAEETKA